MDCSMCVHVSIQDVGRTGIKKNKKKKRHRRSSFTPEVQPEESFLCGFDVVLDPPVAAKAVTFRARQSQPGQKCEMDEMSQVYQAFGQFKH